MHDIVHFKQGATIYDRILVGSPKYTYNKKFVELVVVARIICGVFLFNNSTCTTQIPTIILALTKL